MLPKLVRSPSLHFHFLGISGTAMGSVAAMLKDIGHEVTGSDDNVYPPMSTFLAEKGIRFSSGYRPENLPSNDCIIVVGNAISRGNPELEAALDAKRFYLSLPEVLKNYFLRQTHNLVVTGTHGKTTTTSMLSWIFQNAQLNPSYLIGGLPKNFDQGCKKQKGEFWILEGDEYDTAFFDKRSKFLHYMPELVIINNLEFDHADIYENLDAIKRSFQHLVRIVPRNGVILVNADDENALDVISRSPAPVLKVGFNSHADVRIQNHQTFADHQTFQLFDTEFYLNQTGIFNVRNAAMAIAAAHFYKIPIAKIAEGIKSFEGVRRRQEVRGEVNGITIIDDFGHHPTALRETITGLRQRYPQRRIWALFEPRSATMRRAVFQNLLPEALALADGIFVAQVDRSGQIPDAERLDPEKVVADLRKLGKTAFYEADATAIVAKLAPQLQSGDVVAVFSNGGFGGIHQKLLSLQFANSDEGSTELADEKNVGVTAGSSVF